MRQMNGDFQVRDDHLLRYFHKASALIKGFERVDIRHIPREDNSREDMLSKLNNGKEKGRLTIVIQQVLCEPSMECMIVSGADVDDWRIRIRKLVQQQEVDTLFDQHTLGRSHTMSFSGTTSIGEDFPLLSSSA